MTNDLEKGLGRYTAVFELDDGQWIVHVKEHPNCHSYGATIEAARRHVREALGLFFDDAEEAEIVDDIRLPKSVQVIALRRARAAADAAQAKAQETLRVTVRRLLDLGLSTRDTASIVGMSQQRIAQVAKGA